MLNFYLYLFVSLSYAIVVVARVRRIQRSRMSWVYPALLLGLFLAVKYGVCLQFTSLSLSYVCSTLLLAALVVGNPLRILSSVWFWRLYFVGFAGLVGVYTYIALGSELERKQIFYDPNTEMLSMLVLSFPLMMAHSKKRFRIPLYLLPLLGLLVWLTLSRTGFALIIFLLLSTLPSFAWLLRSRVMVGTVAVAVVALSFLLPLYNSSVEQQDVSERLVSVADGSFQERQLLVLEGLNLWTQDGTSLLIGVPVSRLMDLGTTNSMHNSYLELLVSTGLIGFAAFGGFLVLFARKYLTRITTPLFLAFLLAAGFSVLLLNSMIFLLFVSFFVARPDFGQSHILSRIPKHRPAPSPGLAVGAGGNGDPK